MWKHSKRELYLIPGWFHTTDSTENCPDPVARLVMKSTGVTHTERWQESSNILPGRFLCLASGENLFDDFAMDIRQAEISSGVAIRELFVIKAHQLQHRGVQVMDMNSIFNRLISEFVRTAVGHSAFDATARHPDAEAMMVVVSTCRWSL
jgi:hypothetical protein